MVALVCQNGISSSRTDYTIDRTAVISSAGEPSLNANHYCIVIPIGILVVGVRVTGAVVVVVITVWIIAGSVRVSAIIGAPVIGVTRIITAVVRVSAIIPSVRETYSDVPKNAAPPGIVSMSIDHNRPAVSCLDNPVFGKRRSRYA